MTRMLIVGWMVLLIPVSAAPGDRRFLTDPSVENLQEIKILSPVPLTGGWVGGMTMRIAGKIAQDILNSQQLILPGYYLNTTWLDDTCSPDVGVQVMLTAWRDEPKWVALGSNGCSAVCMKTAISAEKIRIPQISYGCASGSISNQAKYPHITRMMTVEDSMADVFNKLGTLWGWTDIHIITGSAARFDGPSQRLMDYFENKAIKTTWLTPRGTISFADATELMGRVKKAQQRAIVVLGYEPFYRQIICASFTVGIPKGVVWMSVGWHKANWWT